jgi:hypothetical protein
MVAANHYQCTNYTSIVIHLLVFASKQAISFFYPQHSGSQVRLFDGLQATAAIHHKLA